MRSAPEGIDADEVVDALGRHWNLEVDRLDYFPEGGGAYHWVAKTRGAERCFVTGDDLDTKPWLGADGDSVFAGLLAAYRTAMDLRREAGLGFVVAPLPALSGEPAIRLGPRHSLALFPFVAGSPGRWGEPFGPEDTTGLVGLLAELHRSTSVAAGEARRRVGVPGREQLEEALSDLDRPWNGGPFSEPTRRQLAAHAEVVASWLAAFDELRSRLARSGAAPVVTHGEPHPGNLIRTAEGFALVDWDTVALDRPERDLWMLDDGTGGAWVEYRELTGVTVDPSAVALYRLGWKLTDLVLFTAQLRASHRRNSDTERAWTALRRTLEPEGPSPYGEAAIW